MTDTIKFIISEGALLPSYQSKGASGFDVAAYGIKPQRKLPEEERLEGIGYWAISVDFKVS